MDFENLALLVAACFAVNLSPGPSVLLVSSVSAASGARAGLLAVLGMTVGAFVHVLLAASGLAATLAAAPAVFGLVRVLGAAYLIYLGLDLLLEKPERARAASAKTLGSDWQYLRRGFLVDSLNPKIALFFLAFIPQFLVSLESPGFLASVALGSVFLVTGVLVNGTLACLVAAGVGGLRGQAGAWLKRRLPGSILIYLGIRLAWQ